MVPPEHPSHPEPQDEVRRGRLVWHAVLGLILLTAGLGSLVIGVDASPNLERSLHRGRALLKTVAVSMQTGFADLSAGNLEEATMPVPVEAADSVTLYELPSHPSLLHHPAIPVVAADDEVLLMDTRYNGFYDLLDMYRVRQGVDDNFTVRVLDDRTDTVLEVAALEDAREAFLATSVADWDEIDRTRRSLTRDLVDKWVDAGIPRKEITVRWGRRNQVEEARLRDEPFISYELRMARMLGLSLLATEIGTVETFNQDWMVSGAGARSRYQLMPYMLQRFDIHTHVVESRGGQRLTVREEQHPLLAMPASFTLIRAYSNAVGHEIPGISAYQTGPGNIYKVIQAYVDSEKPQLDSTTVLDAFVWGVTDGFSTVSSRTSFRTASRGYLPATYGSLRALEHTPIDLRNAFVGEQVALREGVSLYLSTLLDTLAVVESRLTWGPAGQEATLYDRFRALNPHIPLDAISPFAPVPAEQDILLTRPAPDRPLHFFLPLGAPEALAERGLAWLDPAQTFRFDEDAFQDPRSTGEFTDLDQAYADLVTDIARFGFTAANNRRLGRLYTQFQERAQRNPTLYNHMQAEIIRIHRASWGSRVWRNLAQAVDRLPAPTPSKTRVVPRSTPPMSARSAPYAR